MRTQFKPAVRDIVAILLAIAMVILAMPVSANAAMSDYTLDDTTTSTNGTVSATFTVGDTELNALGYSTTVSIPTEIALTLSGGKFTGTDYVGVSGILSSGKKITVTVDKTNSAYGQISGPSSFTKDISALSSDKLSETLSPTSWTATDCYNNLADKTDGKTIANWTTPGTLSVSISGTSFIPRYKGGYTTVVPLVITLGDE